MCLSKAFLERDGEREVILEQVAVVSVSDGTLSLRNLFGEQREIGGRIREIDFLTHSIVLEEVGPESDRSAGPAGDRPAGPAGDRSAGPAGDRSAGPAGDRSAGPAGDRPAGPAGDRSAGPAE